MRHHNEHGRRHGPHGGNGPGRRGRRPLDHGELRLIVLALLADTPRHGYDLIRAVEELSGGAYSPSPGAIYPTLQWSEEAGFADLDPAAEGRKPYRLTNAGRSYLEASRPALEAAQARLAALTGSGEGPGRGRGRRNGPGRDPAAFRIAEPVLDVLAQYHERLEREIGDRAAGRHADPDSRLLAIGPETGQLVNILARNLSAPVILELGTSYGYSGIWLAEAARAAGGRLITVEKSAEKSAEARRMAELAGLAEHVEFVVGDATEVIGTLPHRFDFVLVDLWNHLYEPCLRAFAPRLNPGAIVVADNIRPDDPVTTGYVKTIRGLPGMTSLPVPVGQGLEISRFLP